MRLRLLVTSLLIAMVTVAPTWLSLQPLLKRALGQPEAWQRASTLVLSLDFGLATLVVYLVLHFTVGRPSSASRRR